ncbi:MAG: hypothetical protein H0V44_05090 [Planctomycetes bacterium]|nr:hypothetical protein [Planctomycetota bacterium]
MAWALMGAACASTIDYPAVENPRSLILADNGAASRWRALFEPYPTWVSRQITFLSWRVPDKAPTLLAARLLYSGEPWSRRITDTTNERRWKASDTETRSAILREIRWTRDPALVEVLIHFLAAETDPGLVKSALMDLWMISPEKTPAIALRLGDPRLKDHLQASSVASTRQNALSFLIDTCGADSPYARQCIEWALLRATGAERNHGITSLERGSVSDLLKPAIIRLVDERRRGELDDEGHAGLVLASSRLGADIDHELAVALVDVAVSGKREIAAAAATALAVNVSWQASVPLTDIGARAANDPDPVIRHALLNLLLRLNPAAAAASGGAASPWTTLSDHRSRLQAWEWEQYVK